MRVFADQPATRGALFPRGTPAPGWRPAPGLDAVTGALWHELCGARTPPAATSPAGAWTLDEHDTRRALAGPVFAPAAAFWSRVVFLSDVPASPFDTLRGRLADLARDAGPTACVALAGRGLHGFRGRHWVVAPGNLHLSAALPLRLPAAVAGPALAMLPPVAVLDAIGAATSGALAAGVKWVSDVLVGEAKVAGCLSATHVRGGEVDLAVVGVGLNVATAPRIAPTPFVPATGCLQQYPGGAGLTLGDMTWHVLAALAARATRLVTEGPATLAHDYRRAALVVGRRVRIWDEGLDDERDPHGWPPARVAGLVVDIDRNLGLCLHGQADAVERGRLAFEESCQAFGL